MVQAWAAIRGSQRQLKAGTEAPGMRRAPCGGLLPPTGHEAGSVWWAPTAKGSSSATSACWGTESLEPLDGAGESTLRGFVEGESKACSSESSNDATELYESGDSDFACRAPNHANATKSRTPLPSWRHLNGRVPRAHTTRILYAPRGDKQLLHVGSSSLSANPSHLRGPSGKGYARPSLSGGKHLRARGGGWGQERGGTRLVAAFTGRGDRPGIVTHTIHAPTTWATRPV